jgi:hypothetical protein
MTNKANPTTLIDGARSEAYEARYRARRRSRIAAFALVLPLIVSAIVFFYRAEEEFLLGAFFVLLLWLLSDAIRILSLPPEQFVAITEYSRQKLLAIYLFMLIGIVFGSRLLYWLAL